MTIANLLAAAQTIYDETTAGANTHQRIGQMFIDIINELAARTELANFIASSAEFYPLFQHFQSPGTLNIFANQIRAYPIRIKQDLIITDVGIGVSTAGAGLLNLALYTDNGQNYPDARIDDTYFNDIDVSSIGSHTLSFASRTLEAGLYWLVTHSNVNTAVRATDSFSQPQTLQQAATDLHLSTTVNAFSDALAYAGLPATFAGGATPASLTVAPLLYIKTT